MKKCLVVMPFSRSSEQHTAEYWERLFESFIKPALQVYGYEAYKPADTPSNITKHIVRELAMADLVLAVLTDGRPNVFYELGVRHSLRNGTIMMTDGMERPFDVSNYGIISYSDQDPARFTRELGRYIRAAEEGIGDSPISDFLNQRITVSVNLAIGRLRECVSVLRSFPAQEFARALEEIRRLQATWHHEGEQVSVVQDDIVVLHLEPRTQGKRAKACWHDETLGASLYSVMKERRWGFRIAQIRKRPNRLTAVAFESINVPPCIVVAEAHYYQESPPY